MEWRGVELRGANCSGAEEHGAGAPSCKVLELAVRLRLLREYQEEFWRVLISGKIHFIIENLHFVGRIPMCKDFKDKNGLLMCMLDASVGWNTSCLSDKGVRSLLVCDAQ